MRSFVAACSILPILLSTVSGCGSGGPGGTTLAYWNRLLESSTMSAGTQGDARSRSIADLRVQADLIERLPTSGVDPEASSIGLGIARLLREQATLAEQGSYLPAAQFIDGFAYGLTGEGNPFESTQAHGADISSWGTRYQAWRDASQRTRVQLTNKYGTEFPNLVRGQSTAYAPSASSPPLAGQPPGTSRSWFKTALMIGGALWLASQIFGRKKTERLRTK